MRCEELKELLPLHLVNLLDEREEATVAAHLERGCPRCVAELAAASEVLAHLPFDLPAQEPSPLVKARLMSAIRAQGEVPARRAGMSWLPAWAAGAAAAAVVAAVVAGGVMTRRYEAAASGLRAEITRQSAEVASLRRQVHEARESIQLVSSPKVTVVNLAGQGERAQAAARVFWDRGRDTWRLYAADLPPAGQGKTYQLWLITATDKISAGTFSASVPVTEAASGSVRVPQDAGPVIAAAITDEPEGGSPQPTGSILLMGRI